MSAQLTNRNILLGITGGIAAYKSCTLCRLLIKNGANVRVVMTPSATKFVSTTTFAALSGAPVAVDTFDKADSISHIALANDIDLMVVAPATANTIAKFAQGLADNMLTNAFIATTAPVLIAPAMNVNMYRNLATQANLNTLRQRGIYIIEPDSGDLACGTKGEGRMPEPEDIYNYIVRLLSRNLQRLNYANNSILPKPEAPLELGQSKLLPKADGASLKVLITAGPTVEAIDPVRFISNRSSGKMAFALAEAAKAHGAEVVIVSGPVDRETPAGVRRINVQTANEMLQAVENEIGKIDIAIGCAAVADYKVANSADKKITKEDSGDELTLKLVRNPDIIATVGKLEVNRPYTVGFAAETNDGEEHARNKLNKKNLDLIVLNNVLQKGIGFGSDDNEVSVYDRDGLVAHLDLQPKRAIADKLIELIFTGAKEFLSRKN
ncbi:MAG: bifunctional phosphopantothenoylcysteine decarboxylase/phosphopantothenate--cysteine ligase CoaBC [Succinivibrio sp.]|nr:bifunctional phosphopantothenoylcysteine decarboxylase/phosphopantothenate--cysteine ligase CoaBC [Succinivibrio sp.]